MAKGQLEIPPYQNLLGIFLNFFDFKLNCAHEQQQCFENISSQNGWSSLIGYLWLLTWLWGDNLQNSGKYSGSKLDFAWHQHDNVDVIFNPRLTAEIWISIGFAKNGIIFTRMTLIEFLITGKRLTAPCLITGHDLQEPWV